MTTALNKTLTRRFIEEALNTGNLAALDEYMAPDYVEHSAPPGLPANREGTKMAFTLLRRAFPDFHYTIDHLIAEDDFQNTVEWNQAQIAKFAGLFGVPPSVEGYEVVAEVLPD